MNIVSLILFTFIELIVLNLYFNFYPFWCLILKNEYDHLAA